MKLFAVAILLGLVANINAQGFNLSPELLQKIDAAKLSCLESTGANLQHVLAINTQGDFSVVEHADKCFNKCFQELLNFSKDGVVNENVIQALFTTTLGEEKVKALQAQCNGVKGTDPCDTAFQFWKCYSTNGGFKSLT